MRFLVGSTGHGRHSIYDCQLNINSNLISPLKCHKNAIWPAHPFYFNRYVHIYIVYSCMTFPRFAPFSPLLLFSFCRPFCWPYVLGINFYDARRHIRHFPLSTFHKSQITGAHFVAPPQTTDHSCSRFSIPHLMGVSRSSLLPLLKQRERERGYIGLLIELVLCLKTWRCCSHC